MKQALHIFQKDTRHFWREIAVSIAALAGFVWSEIYSWTAAASFSRATLFFQKGLPVILVILSWWFLIARAIQDESPVGDRQFWITRPYDWRHLLAAKILFMGVFINLPLFTAQEVLLGQSGFHPSAYLPGLVWIQLLLAAFLLLPLTALAAVTSTVLQMGLASVLVALFIAGGAAVSSYIPSSDFSFDTDALPPAILVGASLAVILWQYARRKTARSRWLIVGAAAAILLQMVVTPYEFLVAREYPEPGVGEALPATLTPVPARTHAAVEVDNLSAKDTVEVNLPWTLSGVANESIVVNQGLMVTLEGANHARWKSGWLSQSTFIYPGANGARLSFEVPKRFFEREKLIPLKAQFSIIMILYADKNRRDFITPSGEFLLPGAGICSVSTQYISTLHCRAALRTPTSFMVSTDLSRSTCAGRAGEPRAAQGEVAHAWLTNSNAEPADFGLTPIASFDFFTSAADFRVNNRGVCPGTPLVLSNPQEVRRFRANLQMDGMRLDDYRIVPGPLQFRVD